ncbi:MAG: hypothetical protein KDK54_12465 [Leptospiraceae bacterium]|nr:hypothetical protein [Leptospiraceae bacterium]
MSKDIPLFYKNFIQSNNFAFKKEYSAMLSKLYSINHSKSPSSTTKSFAEELYKIFQVHPFYKKLNRICLTQLNFPQNELLILSQWSDTIADKNLMMEGYRCYVNPEGSLFKLSSFNIRIYNSAEKILNSFREKNLPPQRSLRYLAEMGIRSGICIPLTDGNSQLIMGFLFLNSFEENYFTNLTDEDYAFFSILQSISEYYIFQNNPKQQYFSPELKKLAGKEKSEFFNLDHFTSYIQSIRSEYNNDLPEIILDLKFKLPFLYIPNKIIYLLSLALLYLKDSKSTVKISIYEAQENIVFSLEHDLNYESIEKNIQLDLLNHLLTKEASKLNLEFYMLYDTMEFKFPLDTHDYKEIFYSV